MNWRSHFYKSFYICVNYQGEVDTVIREFKLTARQAMQQFGDDTPEKIGRFSPGTGIPIVDRSVLASDPPDFLVILAWNFSKDIIAGTSDFSAAGGQYIIPIPGFKLVNAKGES